MEQLNVAFQKGKYTLKNVFSFNIKKYSQGWSLHKALLFNVSQRKYLNPLYDCKYRRIFLQVEKLKTQPPLLYLTTVRISTKWSSDNSAFSLQPFHMQSKVKNEEQNDIYMSRLKLRFNNKERKRKFHTNSSYKMFDYRED